MQEVPTGLAVTSKVQLCYYCNGYTSGCGYARCTATATATAAAADTATSYYCFAVSLNP